MSGLWGWRQLGGVCEIQTAAEENHQGWPTPVGGSPPVSLKVDKDITCKSMGLYVLATFQVTEKKFLLRQDI